MKKEDFIKYVKARGGTLIGYHSVPFPVYVVHVAYDSIDSDPFFPIYKTILQYVEVDPKLETLAYFARVIGFDHQLLDRCKSFLVEQRMIRLNSNTENYIISDDAKRKYINPNSRPTVRVTGSFLVDGKNLDLLPKVIYENEIKLRFWDDNISAHIPVDPELDSAPFGKLLNKLKSAKTLSILRLESEGDNFEVLTVDKKFLLGAFVIYYVDAQWNIIKDLVYHNEQISSEGLESPKCYAITMVNNKKEGWRFVANLGFNVGKTKEMEKIAITSQNEGWADILMKRYSISNDTIFKILYDENNGLPKVELSEDLYHKSDNPKKIIDDCKSGYLELPVFPNGQVVFRVQHNLGHIVDFFTMLENWKIEKKGNLGKDFVDAVSVKYPDWRTLMVEFKFLDVLESIDCACFIIN